MLNSLASLYVEKHLQVHRPAGEFKFFDEETAQLRRGLDVAETGLTDFTRDRGVFSAQMERDLTLQKASALEASLTQTQAAIEKPNNVYERWSGRLRPSRLVWCGKSVRLIIRNCFSR